MSDIERELEETLHRVLDPLSTRPIPARRALQARGVVKTVMGGAGAALTLKLVTGVVAAAAAVTVAGAVTTGSLNPVTWGQQVKQQVSTCKSELAEGDHGIGDCVSTFASQHGASRSSVSSAARQHGNGNGKPNSPGNGNGATGSGNGNGHTNDKSKTHAPPLNPSSGLKAEPVDPVDPAGPHPAVTVSPTP